MSAEIELAWAAGFFDGEGWSNKDADGYPCVALNQVDPEVLERFLQAVGKGRISGPYKNYSYENAQLSFRYHVFGNEAVEIMNKILPYLGSVKTKQWNATIEGCRLPRKKGFCGKSLHEMTPENRDKDGGCRTCSNARQRKYQQEKRERLKSAKSI